MAALSEESNHSGALVRLWFATEVFRETALGLADALAALPLQLEVEVMDCNSDVTSPLAQEEGSRRVATILVGASYLASPLPASTPRRRFAVFQLEQPGSPHFTRSYRDALHRAARVWDFSPVHAARLNDARASPAPVRFVPLPLPRDAIGAVQCQEQALGKEDGVGVDVLFYGACNERRVHVQQCFAAMAPQLNVQFVMGYNLFGEQRNTAIRRSKIVLNLHFYPEAVLEVHRIDFLLAKGACVVSERSADPELDAAYQDTVSFVDMMHEPRGAALIVQRTLELLSTPAERLRLQTGGPDFIQRKQELLKQPLHEAMNELLQESA